MGPTSFGSAIGTGLDARLDAMTPAEPQAYVEARIQVIANFQHQLLSAYAAVNRRDLHRTDGCKSLTDWIQTRTCCEYRTASEEARIADALQDLPRIRACYAAGELHFDQVRHLNRFVTAETERCGPDAGTGGYAPWPERLADALYDLVVCRSLDVAVRASQGRHPARRDDEA